MCTDERVLWDKWVLRIIMRYKGYTVYEFDVDPCVGRWLIYCKISYDLISLIYDLYVLMLVVFNYGIIEIVELWLLMIIVMS